MHNFVKTVKDIVPDYNVPDTVFNNTYSVRQKSVNLYVENIALTPTESGAYLDILSKLPQGYLYGVRVRVWRQWHGAQPYPGPTVTYSVYNDLGEAVEVSSLYDDFDMNTVPWDDVIA